MWLVAHQTTHSQCLRGRRPRQREDFKSPPDGHAGESFNMAPAYAGYLAVEALSGFTRGWLTNKGTAIDSLNLLACNMTAAHESAIR
jgi:phosphoketolase